MLVNFSTNHFRKNKHELFPSRLRSNYMNPVEHLLYSNVYENHMLRVVIVFCAADYNACI